MRIAFSGLEWTALHRYVATYVERAAFFFIQVDEADADRWVARDSMFLDDDADYADRADDHLQLSADVAPRVIRHAHQHELATLEAHGHYWSGFETQFSPYDLHNLRDFAAHMLWRLPDRPYVALVIGEDSFDALAWTPSGALCVPLIEVDGATHEPTGLSLPRFVQMASTDSEDSFRDRD